MSITALAGNIMVDFRFHSIHGTKMVGAYLLRYSLQSTMPGWPTPYRFSNIQAKVAIGA